MHECACAYVRLAKAETQTKWVVFLYSLYTSIGRDSREGKGVTGGNLHTCNMQPMFTLVVSVIT